MTISNLTSNELSNHAFNVFLFSGRNKLGAALIYRALDLDPHNAEALRCLSDFFDTDDARPFSAIALAYALSLSDVQGKSRDELDDLLFLAKWTWGFSRHKSGRTDLPHEAFADRSAFTIDEHRYQDFLDFVIQPTGSLENAVKVARTSCGAIAGFLTHSALGREVGHKECLHPEQFRITPEYEEWLATSTEPLDRLQAERDKLTKRNSKKEKPWYKFWK